MHFLGSKFTQNALAAGAPPWTPLGELKRSPRPSSRFKGAASRQGKGRGKRKEEGRGKGKLGYWEGEKGGKGRGEGGKGEGGGKRRGEGVCVIGVGGQTPLPGSARNSCNS